MQPLPQSPILKPVNPKIIPTVQLLPFVKYAANANYKKIEVKTQVGCK